jgi:hypothetical protein
MLGGDVLGSTDAIQAFLLLEYFADRLRCDGSLVSLAVQHRFVDRSSRRSDGVAHLRTA